MISFANITGSKIKTYFGGSTQGGVLPNGLGYDPHAFGSDRNPSQWVVHSHVLPPLYFLYIYIIYIYYIYICMHIYILAIPPFFAPVLENTLLEPFLPFFFL